MKNLHLIPTDKPSRLADMEGLLVLGDNLKSPIGHPTMYLYQHIYITSDEEIKKGNWIFANQGTHKVTDIKDDKYPYGTLNYKGDKIYHHKNWKKIILTTDQDLIADGIQAIDDDFLEWFVKNPSCESVEVEKQMLCDYCGQEHCDNLRCRGYKDSIWYEITIPQEELKSFSDFSDKFFGSIPQEEHKQETLEEAAENFANDCTLVSDTAAYKAFIAGAKWQAERMYSEEEVIAIVEKSRETGLTAEYLFLIEQFKKK